MKLGRRVSIFVYIIIMLFLAALGPLITYYFYFYVEPSLNTIQVVKAVEDIPRGTLMTSSVVQVVQIKSEEYVEGAFTRLEDLIGLENKYFIRKGQQIIPEMLDMEGVTPKEGEWNAPIPNDWIFAMPGSLLRGDHISLFAVPPERAQEKTELLFAEEQPRQPKILSPEELQKEIEKYKTPVITDLVVSFSKAGNNVEVTTEDHQRLKPTANVHNIEVVVDQQKWEKILSHTLQGYRFIVMYR